MKTEEIIEDILRRARARKPWQPNTPQIMDEYGLTDRQARYIVRRTKHVAATKYNMMWGWDPVIFGFRIVPANAPKVAKRVIDYSFEHASDALVQTQITVLGARNQGYITEPKAQDARTKVRLAEKLVTKAHERIM